MAMAGRWAALMLLLAAAANVCLAAAGATRDADAFGTKNPILMFLFAKICAGTTMEKHPLANVDTFRWLSDTSPIFASLGNADISTLLDRINSKRLTEFVSVVLVGFNGDGAGGIRVDAGQFRRRLERLQLPSSPSVFYDDVRKRVKTSIFVFN